MKRLIATIFCVFILFTVLGRNWFGLGQDDSEISVERSIIDGVYYNDSVWDLSNIVILKEDAGYKVRQINSKFAKYIFEENGQSLFFVDNGDSLILRGSMGRLGRDNGYGAIDALPNSTVMHSNYHYKGKREQMWNYTDSGEIITEHFRSVLAMDNDTLKNLHGVRVKKIGQIKWEGDTSRSVKPDTLESIRIYSPYVNAPILEGRRLYREQSDYTYYLLSSVLSNGLKTERPIILPEKSSNDDSNFSVCVDYPAIAVTYTINPNDLPHEVEFILCSLSGITYTHLYKKDVRPGTNTEIIHYEFPSDDALLIVKIGSDTYKHILTR